MTLAEALHALLERRWVVTIVSDPASTRFGVLVSHRRAPHVTRVKPVLNEHGEMMLKATLCSALLYAQSVVPNGHEDVVRLEDPDA